MGYAKLTKAQEALLQRVVEGKRVYDIGCGDMELTHVVARYAKRVNAIDPNYRFKPSTKTITFKKLTADSACKVWPSELPVVLLSWPLSSYIDGVLPLLKRAETIVYIGKNTDGVACGFVEMWRYLTTRKLVVEIPASHNTMLVYSSDTFAHSEYRSEEEIGGLLVGSKLCSLPYGTLRR